MKITEDYLKTNGWEVHHYDHPALKDRCQYATKMFGKNKVNWNERKELTIFRDYEEDSDIYADVLIDNVDTIEKLQDALVLCGVEEKSEKPTNALIDKACKWLTEHTFGADYDCVADTTSTTILYHGQRLLATEFRKAMED